MRITAWGTGPAVGSASPNTSCRSPQVCRPDAGDPYAELFWFSAQEFGGSGVAALDVGTSCHLRDRLTVDGGLQVGLSHAAPTFSLFPASASVSSTPHTKSLRHQWCEGIMTTQNMKFGSSICGWLLLISSAAFAQPVPRRAQAQRPGRSRETWTFISTKAKSRMACSTSIASCSSSITASRAD